VVLFPVLRRVDQVLATGYLIMRGAVETACYVILAIGWLLLVPLGDAMSVGPGTASPAGVGLGSLVVDDEAVNAVLALVFCLGATMFYVLLYQSRIVPRWIAMWGLVAMPRFVGPPPTGAAMVLSRATSLSCAALRLIWKALDLALPAVVAGFDDPFGQVPGDLGQALLRPEKVGRGDSALGAADLRE